MLHVQPSEAAMDVRTFAVRNACFVSQLFSIICNNGSGVFFTIASATPLLSSEAALVLLILLLPVCVGLGNLGSKY